MNDSFRRSLVDLLNRYKHEAEKDESNAMQKICMNTQVDGKTAQKNCIFIDRLIRREKDLLQTSDEENSNKCNHKKTESDERTLDLDTSQGSFYSEFVRREGMKNLSSFLCNVDGCNELLRKEGVRNLSSSLYEVAEEKDLTNETSILFEVR